MELATPLIPTSAIAALPRSRSHSRSPRIMGYNNDDNHMRSHSPRVNDEANFEFDDPPSVPAPLSPSIGYLMQREGGDSPSITGHSSSTFPNLSLSAFPMPPSLSAVALPPFSAATDLPRSPSAAALPPFSSAVPLPPSLSRTTSRGLELASGQEESGERGEDMELSGGGEHESGEGGERMERALDGVQGILGEAGIALSEVRAGLEEWDRT